MKIGLSCLKKGGRWNKEGLVFKKRGEGWGGVGGGGCLFY